MMPSMEQTLEGSKNPYTVGVEVHTGLSVEFQALQKMLENMQTDIMLIESRLKNIEGQINDVQEQMAHEKSRVNDFYKAQAELDDFKAECEEIAFPGFDHTLKRIFARLDHLEKKGV